MDYYKTLGVEKSTPPAGIKKAYRKLALKYHPDKTSGDKELEAKFKEISEAYAVLSDPEKKKQYDTYGSADFRQRYSQEDIFKGFDLNDILRQFGFGGNSGSTANFRTNMGGGRTMRGGSPFESFYNQAGGNGGCGGGGFHAAPEKGQDMTYQITVTLEEVLNGAERTISLRKNGESHNVSVKIPQGIEEGKKLRLQGKGGVSRNGGPPGDLYLKVGISPNEQFTREGDDLIIEKLISFSDACLGAKVEVETLEGKKFMVKVAPGTVGESKLRIRGYGLPAGPMGERGDLYVQIGVKVPRELSDEQKEVVEQLRVAGL
jgi:curved DNA-binding protein